MKIRRLLGFAFVAAVAITALAPIPAFAADPIAESLFQEGLDLYSESRFEESCAALTASLLREKKSGTLVVLASCHERLGKTATAWAEYLEAAALARAEGRASHADKAASLAREVESKLSKVVIRYDAMEPNVSLLVNGAAVVPNVQFALDPGEHTLRASAPDYQDFTLTFRVEPSEQRALQVPVLVPIESKLPLGAVGPPDVGPPPERASSVPPIPSVETPEATVWPWAVGATGVLLLGVSAGMLAMSVDASATLDDACGVARDDCPRSYDFSADRTRELAGFGVFLGLGLPGLGLATTAIVGLSLAP